MVKICPKCGTQAISDQSLFCNKCGTRLIDKQGTSLKSTGNNYDAPFKLGRTDKIQIRDEYPLTPSNEQFSEHSKKQIREVRCICNSCGNVWYYKKRDILMNANNACSNCSSPWPWIRGKKVIDYNRCPKCGSRAIRKEEIVHEVE